MTHTGTEMRGGISSTGIIEEFDGHGHKQKVKRKHNRRVESSFDKGPSIKYVTFQGGRGSEKV